MFTFREIGKQKEKNLGNSLAIQWLGLRLSLWGLGSISGLETWSRKPHNTAACPPPHPPPKTTEIVVNPIIQIQPKAPTLGQVLYLKILNHHWAPLL